MIIRYLFLFVLLLGMEVHAKDSWDEFQKNGVLVLDLHNEQNVHVGDFLVPLQNLQVTEKNSSEQQTCYLITSEMHSPSQCDELLSQYDAVGCSIVPLQFDVDISDVMLNLIQIDLDEYTKSYTFLVEAPLKVARAYIIFVREQQEREASMKECSEHSDVAYAGSMRDSSDANCFAEQNDIDALLDNLVIDNPGPQKLSPIKEFFMKVGANIFFHFHNFKKYCIKKYHQARAHRGTSRA